MNKNWQQLQKKLGRQHKHHHYLSTYTIGIFAIGAAAGAAAGMLMAPEKGEETRVKLVERAQAALAASQRKMASITEKAKQKMTHANEKAQTAAEKGKRAMTTAAPARRTPTAA